MSNVEFIIEEKVLLKDSSSAVFDIALDDERKTLLQHGVFVFGHPSKYMSVNLRSVVFFSK